MAVDKCKNLLFVHANPRSLPQKITLIKPLINPRLYIAYAVPSGTRLVTTHPHSLLPSNIPLRPKTSNPSRELDGEVNP